MTGNAIINRGELSFRHPVKALIYKAFKVVSRDTMLNTL
jgi:hypothetical protein